MPEQPQLIIRVIQDEGQARLYYCPDRESFEMLQDSLSEDIIGFDIVNFSDDETKIDREIETYSALLDFFAERN
jgi:hypothetical protein